LRTLLGDLSEHWINHNEGPDTWSPYDVVGHLVHTEEVNWIARIQMILEHGASKTFPPLDRFAFLEKLKGKPLSKLLDTFDKLRKTNLRNLSGMNLKPEHFELQGRHPDFGSVKLGQLLATWTVHDLNHIRQIARVMAKQYSEAVGPWKVFLPILDE
nr:DinB family protein [candidate division KSB1 bacterium]NIS28138.1 DinB family protein [candidate division KSB1 bacterium]NIT75034.1 DinB family protein [candidate division KSB1 bacterium]NIU28818.1 DinB family protein [candidate division KSB1 bacterium]NIU92539.1 DinB family protein [candidate division KSB1 bacterium]